MADIVLSTLNARYYHSAFGLRYLLANLSDLQARTRLLEFTIAERPMDIAEQILAESPTIVGIGVYIWNAEQSLQVVKLLRRIQPQLIIILGGPEISHEIDQQTITPLVDYIVAGAGEIAFQQLTQQLLDNTAANPTEKVHRGPALALDAIELPYDYYTDEDIKNRIIYVEASRGCPFKCSFCLSALDKTAKSFELSRFLLAMASLYERGVRSFKFVDRTFNLNTQVSVAILDFFLAHLGDELFVHFEVIPDRLPAALKERIQRFPPGTLQFEIGVQTFNSDVQTLIERKQNQEKTIENIRWLREHSGAHLHTDLILGLPGESLASIASSFDQLISLKPHEIQVGILKRLRGMPMRKLETSHALVFSPDPPYEILSNRDVDFLTMQRLRRFARYWDLVGNKARFPNTLPILLGDNPFRRFLQLSDWLHDTTGQTHRIGLPRLINLLYQALQSELGLPEAHANALLSADFKHNRLKGYPRFQAASTEKVGTHSSNRRQQRHLAGESPSDA